MEQTKIEVQDKDKTPDKEKSKEKPKHERTPLTEAERLRRQKMIVLPAMVLVFLGAMWLIFAPSSDETREPGMDGYNMEMPTRRTGRLSATRRKPMSRERWRNARKTATAR